VEKKVVLVAPHNDIARFSGLAHQMTVPGPALGIMTVGSYLAANDVPVELIDIQADYGVATHPEAARLVYERIVQDLAAQAHDISWIGFSHMSSLDNSLPLGEKIHAALPEIPIVFGGYSAARNHESLLRSYPFLSGIVRGDGETTALLLSQCLARNEGLASCPSPNLACRDGDRIRTGAVESVSLEGYPPLDFTLLRNPGHFPIAYLETSRGCPFKCNYCLEYKMRPYSVLSAAWVELQLDHLEAVFPSNRIVISDPLFAVGRKRVLDLVPAMRGRGLTYFIESRGDVIAPDLIPSLKEAGVEMLWLGVESASPDSLVRMNKIRSHAAAEVYLEKTLAVLTACFEHDVTPALGIILSFPGDTEPNYQATLEFIRRIEDLHDRITARTGIDTGFKCTPRGAQVYDGSDLADLMEGVYANVGLTSVDVIGTRKVIEPSPGVGEGLLHRYQREITRHVSNTPLAEERWSRYVGWPLDNVLTERPDLVNEEGLIILGDYYPEPAAVGARVPSVARES
jgi:radical SAM superfamily enzyme YgiQ (UPF0313 family)